MGRTAAVIWHASFSIASVVLYFLFVLPRTLELLGDTPHTLGTVLRVAAGALIGLAALPVVFTLLRTRRPEFGTPQLALNLRTVSISLHVLAGVVIIGAAISEIWLTLDTAGQWLFGAYGAAGAVALLGVFAFYLAFVAELPPPPPKPLKVKERSERRGRKDAKVEGDAADEPQEAAETEAVEESSAVEVTTEADEAPATEDSDSGAEDGVNAESDEKGPQAADGSSDGKLQNRRPTGKGSVLGRRRKTRGGVAVED